MTFLVSHLWILYLLAVALAGITFAVMDKPGFEILASVGYAAIPDFIAAVGIWFLQKGYLIPAGIVAVLCCVATVLAFWLFWNGGIGHTHEPSKMAGVAAGILCVIAVVLCCVTFAGDLPQILVTSCCLCGMISVAYGCGYVVAFAKGMGGP
ncbi:MAG: hypothetical protein K5695_00150 [Oscillospiraceae bacterium]|nr:hypothetical protein [Oscillospiraceae bacterium]